MKQRARFFFHEESLILLFSNTEVFLFLLQLCCHQRIDMNDIYEKRSLIKKTGSDAARQRVCEQEKMNQSEAMLLGVCFTCSSKGHASWLWLVVFDPYFLVVEKPLPMKRTCTVVNFRNLHGQFNSLLQKEFTVFPIKPWTPEKISGMFIVSRPIWC